MKKRLLRTLILCAAALLVGAAIGLIQVEGQRNAIVIEKGSISNPMVGVPIGGSFTLTDQNGHIVTEKDFKGQYRLVFFGFTSCPAICPTELQKMSKAVTQLGSVGDKIQLVFITVDPERDTVETMKSYVEMFHPRLIGLTGTTAQIEGAKKTYRVYAAKTEDENSSEYTFNHSSFIYLMSPDNELLSLYRMEDTADFIAEDIRKKLAG